MLSKGYSLGYAEINDIASWIKMIEHDLSRNRK